jgi:hypothetical protein
MTRAARYELLVSLGRLGLHEIRAGNLRLANADETATAAKRVFGIADPLLLERRAAELAGAVEAPVEALDLALYNWSLPAARATLGFAEDAADEPLRERVESALRL